LKGDYKNSYFFIGIQHIEDIIHLPGVIVPIIETEITIQEIENETTILTMFMTLINTHLLTTAVEVDHLILNEQIAENTTHHEIAREKEIEIGKENETEKGTETEKDILQWNLNDHLHLQVATKI
jgi:hypothetical protein